jgi:uncharacterized protein (DUF2267 family)
MQYDEFIEQVQARSRTTDRREAERLTEIVLSTLTEPLSREITNRLSSQLPKELKQLVEKHHTDPLQTMKQYGLEEFYNRVKSRLDVTYSEGVRMAQAVAGCSLRQSGKACWMRFGATCPTSIANCSAARDRAQNARPN